MLGRGEKGRRFHAVLHVILKDLGNFWVVFFQIIEMPWIFRTQVRVTCPFLWPSLPVWLNRSAILPNDEKGGFLYIKSKNNCHRAGAYHQTRGRQGWAEGCFWMSWGFKTHNECWCLQRAGVVRNESVHTSEPLMFWMSRCFKKSRGYSEWASALNWAVGCKNELVLTNEPVLTKELVLTKEPWVLRMSRCLKRIGGL